MTPMLTAPARGVPGPLVALVLLTLGASGCGGETPAATAATKKPDAAVTACRGQWKDLEKTVAARSAGDTPSALAERWNSVAATVDYYATSATADDCDTTLATQTRSIGALTAFARRLAPYDLELRLSRLEQGATAYAARTKAPATKPAKKGAKAPKAPAPKAVGLALRTLTTQAPLASRQQGPAWEQANAVDLTSKASVAKAVKDLKFLSSESKAYRSASAAARQIATAVRLAG